MSTEDEIFDYLTKPENLPFALELAENVEPNRLFYSIDRCT